MRRLNVGNGVEVYEADILKNPDGSTEEVVWGESDEFPDTQDFSTTYLGFSLMGTPDEFEVIGNIHENPELLKSEDT